MKQNAVAAAAAPYPGQYAGYETYPYSSAAAAAVAGSIQTILQNYLNRMVIRIKVIHAIQSYLVIFHYVLKF